MPGAWEQQHKVMVGILHTENTSMPWSLAFRNLIVPGNIIVPVSGMPYDMARNTICMKALEFGCTSCFMLDSDVACPHDTILRLLRHNLPIVSGMYSRRSPPHGLPVMIKNGTWFTNFKRGSLVEVDLVGAGCLLIRRDVLENMPPQRPGHHWFDWRVNMQGLAPRDYCLSEDFTFCKAAKDTMGIKTMVDTSIECRHVGLAEATFGNFKPAESTPVT